MIINMFTCQLRKLYEICIPFLMWENKEIHFLCFFLPCVCVCVCVWRFPWLTHSHAACLIHTHTQKALPWVYWFAFYSRFSSLKSAIYWMDFCVIELITHTRTHTFMKWSCVYTCHCAFVCVCACLIIAALFIFCTNSSLCALSLSIIVSWFQMFHLYAVTSNSACFCLSF